MPNDGTVSWMAGKPDTETRPVDPDQGRACAEVGSGIRIRMVLATTTTGGVQCPPRHHHTRGPVCGQRWTNSKRPPRWPRPPPHGATYSPCDPVTAIRGGRDLSSSPTKKGALRWPAWTVSAGLSPRRAMSRYCDRITETATGVAQVTPTGHGVGGATYPPPPRWSGGTSDPAATGGHGATPTTGHGPRATGHHHHPHHGGHGGPPRGPPRGATRGGTGWRHGIARGHHRGGASRRLGGAPHVTPGGGRGVWGHQTRESIFSKTGTSGFR